MHSAELSVEDESMTRYKTSLEKLVQQFNNVPQTQTTMKQQIDEVSVFGCVSVVVDFNLC